MGSSWVCDCKCVCSELSSEVIVVDAMSSDEGEGKHDGEGQHRPVGQLSAKSETEPRRVAITWPFVVTSHGAVTM